MTSLIGIHTCVIASQFYDSLTSYTHMNFYQRVNVFAFFVALTAIKRSIDEKKILHIKMFEIAQVNDLAQKFETLLN